MKTVFTQPLTEFGKGLLPQEYSVYVANDTDPMNFSYDMADADMLCIRIGKCGRDTIEMAEKLKVIGRIGVGFDSVDIEAANEKGIPVVITPGANNISVAEHALTMAMALSKNLVEGHNEMCRGRWEVREANKAFELRGKRAGILGFGSVGRETAKLFAGIGMNVGIYDPFVEADAVKAYGFDSYSDYNELLRVSDIVSVHMPLTDETRSMIAIKQLSEMKNSALVINTGRGGIVDETDLVKALEQGEIAGAALDVFCSEPPKKDDPLLNCRNLIVSPHSAARTKEAVRKMEKMCIEGCVAVLKGYKCSHVASKAVYEHPKWKNAEWMNTEK